MILFVFFPPNASGAKSLRKWAEKAFASSTLVFHGLEEGLAAAGWAAAKKGDADLARTELGRTSHFQKSGSR
jgi:hypothetical protein